MSTTNTVNDLQSQFLNRLITEIEDALLFPRTLPVSEQYPENILTNIRRLVFSSYGLLAINFRKFFVEILQSNVGQPPTTVPFWEGSTFSQIESAMAFQFGIPILLVRERELTSVMEFGLEESDLSTYLLIGIPTTNP
ncbi:hypothetical protein P4H66_15585 [Paenibacillus dokdonensis]|uniref:Uncharacterized protein n=1 Tax=Paenibacillus dokdonensis TaxID=2567944 RepID=A0ABU6GPB8_9BACL|nr:hypothetical protein [Paenibacillus dokdonensis]MEC0241273.1 hypothetical protein [Paenibacillus dokdonensis]